jgi:hypothetical protein
MVDLRPQVRRSRRYRFEGVMVLSTIFEEFVSLRAVEAEEVVRGWTVETGIETSDTSGGCAWERCVAQGKSAGPNCIREVSHGIQGYPAVRGQLAAGHRDHAG